MNLKDQSPFKSEHREGLSKADLERWDALYQSGPAGGPEAVLAALDKALLIDDRYAGLHYRRGRALLELGRFEEARAAFLLAVDEDVAPLRMVYGVRQAFRETVKRLKVPVIDFVSMVEDETRARHGHAIPGRELFVDHVHPTIAAHKMLALSLLRWLMDERIAISGGDWGDEAIATVSRRVEGCIDKLAHGIALQNLAGTMSWAGKFEESFALSLKALELLGEDAKTLLMIGMISEEMGNKDQALGYYRRALATGTSDAVSHMVIAKLLTSMNKVDEALFHLSEMVRTGKK